jgi:hypothetical protein
MTPGPRNPYFGGGEAEEAVRIPDGITPILAYRIWGVDELGNVLSMNGRLRWPESTWVYARCRSNRDDPRLASPSHRPPAEGCSCGIYAVKTLGDLWEAVGLGLFAKLEGRRPSQHPWAVGVVELAGKVIEHDIGYRSERARIAGIVKTTPFIDTDAWCELCDGGGWPPEAA